MASPFIIFFFFLCHFLNISLTSLLIQAAPGGQWDLLQKSIGISAMHMQLLHNDRVIIFDRTDFGLSNLTLPTGKCRTNDQVIRLDCTAHSAEYNIASNSIRPLRVQTDVFCSSGSVLPNGTLIQTGGFRQGERAVRIFRPCKRCDWEEIPFALNVRRWYATNQLLPDGRIIVIGGRRQFNYEFYPKSNLTNQVFVLPLLSQTNDPTAENNLYPFVYLNVDGNLFIFANNRSILFDYTKNMVVKTFPEMPDGDPRTYPSTGSSVLLPLYLQESSSMVEAEVLICGGAPRGSFEQAHVSKHYIGALNTCGRIKITDQTPTWSMETMPLARVMGDMTLLPNGHVLIINGAASGTAGWENGDNPVFYPLLYTPDDPSGFRFEMQNPSSIPRLYHSTAILVRDGRVLVGGSNPHVNYMFGSTVRYPTELSMESFSPEYLGSEFLNLRPTIVSPSPVSPTRLGYRQQLTVRFTLQQIMVEMGKKDIWVTMVAPSFTTHSFAMNQRLLVLGGGGNGIAIRGPLMQVGRGNDGMTMSMNWEYEVTVMTPASTFLAPPGYYLVFVVHKDIPSEGVWVQMQPQISHLV